MVSEQLFFPLTKWLAENERYIGNRVANKITDIVGGFRYNIRKTFCFLFQVEKEHNIEKQNAVKDCCIVMFCEKCSLCQLRNEMFELRTT